MTEGIVFFLRRAERLFNEGKYEQCINVLTDIINSPDSTKDEKASAYRDRGTAKQGLQQYEGAIADYDQAIELFTDDKQKAIAYNNRGTAKQELDPPDYKGAIADYDKAIKLDENDASVYNNRGNAKSDLQDYTGAIADYDQAIKLDEKYAIAYNNRGNAKAKLKQYKEAIADYDQAIELFTDDEGKASAYYNRGNAKQELDPPDYKGAIESYDKAIELDENYAAAYYNRGNAKQRLPQYKDTAEAKEDIQTAIDIECENTKKNYKPIICYKFRPINKHTIDLLVKKKVYFSDIESLNDPLECPLLDIPFYEDIFKNENNKDYKSRILSLMVPPDDERDVNGICKTANNPVLFSHYADAHKGICIEYEITKELLDEGKIYYTLVEYSTKIQVKSIKNLFAIKDEKWSYENEGRFVSFGGKSTDGTKGIMYEEGIHIKKIIFGLKTTDEDKKLLHTLLKEHEGIKFYETEKEPYSFNLTFEEYQPKSEQS